MQRVRQQGKLTNDVQERREAIGQAVSARREGIQTVPDCKNGVRSGSWGEEWQQRGKRARVKERCSGRVEGKAEGAREVVWIAPTEMGRFQVVRRGRTNLQARQELDPKAGAIGWWLPVWSSTSIRR
jgi:hypothetical protein